MTDDSEAERPSTAVPADRPEPAGAQQATSAGSIEPATDSTAATPTDATPDAAGANAAGERDVAPTGSYLQRRRARRSARRSRPKRKAPWWELPALVLLAVLIAVGVKTWVVQPFYIPSASMEQTLHGCPGCRGDRILVEKPIYDFRDPHPGDIVVFHRPSGWGDSDETISRPPSNPVLRAIRGFGQLVGFVPPDGEIIVKRVIATGGQTVRGLILDSAGHTCAEAAQSPSCHDVVQISLHGTAGPWRSLDEPYVYGGDDDSYGTFGPVTVPHGRLWVLGDHRDDSADSRAHCSSSPDAATFANDGPGCVADLATVPIDDVIGKAFVIAWPPSRWRTLGTPSTFEQPGALADAVTPAVPSAVSVVAVLPLWALRRRRRHRQYRGEDRRGSSSPSASSASVSSASVSSPSSASSGR